MRWTTLQLAVLAALAVITQTRAQPSGTYQPDTAELVPQDGSSTSPEDLLDSRAPLRLGDISIIHVTDVHSYISGHRHGESRVSTGYGDSWHEIDSAPQDADYADLLSFVEHMKFQAQVEGKDLWVVNSGDVVDGTGISNLSPVNGANLLPLLQQIPFDAVTIGNHELYSSSTVANMASSGFIGHWGSAYVTSNIQSADDTALTAGKSVGEPLGAPYTVLRGEFGHSILVLGFLYNMDDHCDSVEVVHAEDAVAQPWFVEAMGAAAEVDAVVVLSHMDLEATELATIRGAVRDYVGQDKPLTFMAGHSHYRRFNIYDNRTAALESGNYFNTVGWISYDIASSDSHSPLEYNLRMLDANKATLESAVTVPDEEEFLTERGASLREDILSVRASMGLDEVLGCSPVNVTMSPSSSIDMDDQRSAWGYVMTNIIPTVLFDPPNNPAMWEVESTGGIRAPLYTGAFTVDDLFALSPFGNKYYAIEGVPGATVDLLYQHLVYGGGGDCDSCGHVWDGRGKPPFACTDQHPDHELAYTVIVSSYDKDRAIGPAFLAVDNSTDWVATAVPYRHDELTSSTIYKAYACTADDWACPEQSVQACNPASFSPLKNNADDRDDGGDDGSFSTGITIVMLLGVFVAVGIAVATKQGYFKRFEKGGGEKGDSMYVDTDSSDGQLL